MSALLLKSRYTPEQVHAWSKSKNKFMRLAAGTALTVASGVASAAPDATELKTMVDTATANATAALTSTQLAILGVVVLMMAFGLIYSLVRR